MKKDFLRDMFRIALPITIQGLLQAALSLIDQIMIGRLGSASIAGVGLGAKFISLFTVTMTAIVTVAGILIAQYCGSKQKKGVSDSFFANLYLSLLVAVIFMVLSLSMPGQIMGLYSKDTETVREAVMYLKIMTVGFLPQTATLMLSALLRNMDAAKIPMIAGGVSVISNTVLNYLLIFGIGSITTMGVAGAALATAISRIIEMCIILGMFIKLNKKKCVELNPIIHFEKDFIAKIMVILAPILCCEFLWSLGENVYAIIYGRIGTESCAAMTLTYPLQTLAIGALSGVSAAAGVMIGNLLGKDDKERAYADSKSFVKVTIVTAVIISALIALLGSSYVKMFQVSADTRQLTVYILFAYALVFPAKVINMVLGGGILRSGGKTKYIMAVDMIGTWVFGVPLGLFSAYILKVPIHYVYFLLSLEEYVRVLLCAFLFKSKRWMVNMTEKEKQMEHTDSISQCSTISN